MATVSILSPPDTTANMATRRGPLLDKPNAINSPFRGAATANGKRTRAQAGDQKDAIYGQPPTKRQAIEARDENEENLDPRKRNAVVIQDKHEDNFSKPRGSHSQTALEKKLASVRKERPTPQPRTERPQKHGDNYESVRQWQKHYRRQFPQFVFYFDGVISEDTRAKHMRQIHQLGAREEKFFSRAVTHVVTTRSIPTEQSATSPDEAKYETIPKAVPQAVASRTGDRATMLLDQRRSQHAAVSQHPSFELRKHQPQATDILVTAQSLGIKIWALEKLHRVLSTILDTDTSDRTHDSRGHSTTRVATRQTQDADLEQLLRHEKVNGPADRDMTVATQDMSVLRGCYIYVHDMDEKTKPVMVRDYSKPTTKEQGKWPQFRLSGVGRCPFVEDPAHAKKLQQQEERALSKAQLEIAHRKTRAGSALPMPPMQALVEREANLRRSPRKLSQPPKPNVSKPLDPPPTRRQSSAEMPPLFGSAQANLRGMPRMIGGEPMASGVQRSNITSAIRSQAVSSAAISSTAPGLNRRVGDTKEVALLRRKMLSNGSIPSSHATDLRTAINTQDPPPRAAKRKAQETLGVVHEDGEAGHSKARSAPKRAKMQKEAKPGYCENCRDKYDDFDEHTVSRKHRKFAAAQENWAELDNLLAELKRPLKQSL